MSEIGQELSSIHEGIPAIERKSARYEGVLSSQLEEQVHKKQLLANSAQVLEILEVTQLMETCIRHGNYDEALDLELCLGLERDRERQRERRMETD